MIESTQLQSKIDHKPMSVETHTHSEWYYDPDGDLEILSSDGILLKMAAYSLQASS
jgi:hypothetical protein